MPPSLIESCAADLCNDEICSSSSVDFGGQRLSMTKNEILRKSDVSSPQDAMKDRNSPRFSLRKRNMPDDQRGDIISSYYSDFLSGIFADIAKATSSEERDNCFDQTQPSKKSRISLSKSISRCGRSYANLAAVSPTPEQSRRLLNVRLPDAADALKTQRASKQDLHHCVSSTSSEENSHFAKLAFPQLPSSVKDSSSFTLTPTNKGQQSPESEKPSKDYGWFVEMDEECAGLSVNAYNNTSQKNLAFLAPTAPNGVDQDAEVEWAKAADTVDDVLGDFF